MVFRFDAVEPAMKVLSDNGIRIVSAEHIRGL